MKKREKKLYDFYKLLQFLVIIVFIILSNKVVFRIPWNLDLSAEKLFTLSPETVKSLSALENPVTIYYLTKPGEESFFSSTILELYAKASSMVQIKKIDPYLNPALIRELIGDDDSVSEGTLLISGVQGTEMVKPDEFGHAVDEVRTLLTIEVSITQAVMKVGFGAKNILYYTTGHGEKSPDEGMLNRFLSGTGVSYRELNLFKEGSVPKDAGLVVLHGMKEDLHPAEVDALIRYAEEGGRVFILTDYRARGTDNLNTLLGGYAIRIMEGFIMDTSGGRREGDPFSLIPEYSKHPLLEALGEGQIPMLLSFPQPIVRTGPDIKGVNVSPLLRTPEHSSLRKEINDDTMHQLPGDVSGPFIVALALEEKIGADRSTRIVLVTSSNLLEEQYGSSIVGGNYRFYASALQWLMETRETSLQVPSKLLVQRHLDLQGKSILALSFFYVLILPSLFFFAGIGIWIYRRSR